MYITGYIVYHIMIMLIQRKLLYDTTVHISLGRGHLRLKINIYSIKVLILQLENTIDQAVYRLSITKNLK